MNKRYTRFYALLLTVTIFASIIPSFPVQAVEAMYFQFKNFSTDKLTPTPVNSELVDIHGTFNGVSSSSISFKVETMVNDQVVSTNQATNVQPIISNTNIFSFMSVKLGPGLNRITVFGKNALGNTVEGVAYVQYSYVPVIHDIKLADGRVLQDTRPEVVDTRAITIQLQAPNSTSVTVQNKKMFSSDGKTFLLSGIELKQGINTLEFLASNALRSYKVKRQVVRCDGPTAYGISIGGTAIDGQDTISPSGGASLDGRIEGQLVFKKSSRDINPTKPTQARILIKSPSAVTQSVNATILQDQTIELPDYTIFSYQSDDAVSLGENGTYEMFFSATYGSQIMSQYKISFEFMNSTRPFIKDVIQVYNPTIQGSVASYTSSAELLPNTTVAEMPFWLSIRGENFQPGMVIEAFSEKDRQRVPVSIQVYESAAQNNERLVQIQSLPSGYQKLSIQTSVGGTPSDTTEIPLTFVPAPYVQLINIYDNQVFQINGGDPAQSKNFTSVKGKVINFLSTDYGSLKMTLNGKTVPINVNADGTFQYDILDQSMYLVPGSNQLMIFGTANQIPVQTHVTLYLFSDEVPNLRDIKPVPARGLDEVSEDTLNLFKKKEDLSYVTHENEVDVLFEVENAKTITIRLDGQQQMKAEYDALSGWDARSDTPAPTELKFVDSDANRHRFRIRKINLPHTGVKSITITAISGTASVNQTLQITRELSPYILLSPRFPEEKVINQNFINVSIQAEGADQVLLGKDPMKQAEGSSSIFRHEIGGLKPGKNTIKFTVLRGKEKLTDQFEVNYVASDLLGAQYKTTIPKSGKISLFQNTLSLTFPKNTLLRKANEFPGRQAETINLFDVQPIMFGVADRYDGRTIKRYNRVGERELDQPMDGNLREIAAQDGAIQHFNPIYSYTSRTGYASELYWIDAGYFESTDAYPYQTVPGDHPYVQGNLFFERLHLKEKWLEPTQRGTISIKYDTNLRDVASTQLSIWRLGDQGWVNLGGVVDTKKKTVTAALEGFGYYAVIATRFSMDDIIGHKYARNSLETMLAKQIMKAKNLNEFGVYDNITRGEFATMLVKALDIPLEYESDSDRRTFDDVPTYELPDSLWDYRHIETAVRKGIIRGLSPKIFMPTAYLTRESAATMIARAMNLKAGDLQKDSVKLQKSFTDANQIDSYMVSAVLSVYKAGIITGIENQLAEKQKKPTYRFDPKSNLTRADAAVIAERVMKKLKKL